MTYYRALYEQEKARAAELAAALRDTEDAFRQVSVVPTPGEKGLLLDEIHALRLRAEQAEAKLAKLCDDVLVLIQPGSYTREIRARIEEARR